MIAEALRGFASTLPQATAPTPPSLASTPALAASAFPALPVPTGLSSLVLAPGVALLPPALPASSLSEALLVPPGLLLPMPLNAQIAALALSPCDHDHSTSSKSRSLSGSHGSASCHSPSPSAPPRDYLEVLKANEVIISTYDWEPLPSHLWQVSQDADGRDVSRPSWVLWTLLLLGVASY